MGFPLGEDPRINPKMIVASIKAFGPGPYKDCKVYESAQCTGGAAIDHRLPRRTALVTAADRRQRHRFAFRARQSPALYHAPFPARAIRSPPRCKDGVAQSRGVKAPTISASPTAPLREYSQFGEGIPFGDAVPRAGTIPAAGQPGRILKWQGLETDPNAYIYFITQAPGVGEDCDVIASPPGRPIRLRQPPPAVTPQRDLRAHRTVDDDQTKSRRWTS